MAKGIFGICTLKGDMHYLAWNSFLAFVFNSNTSFTCRSSTSMGNVHISQLITLERYKKTVCENLV